jgi:hypothetical protein
MLFQAVPPAVDFSNMAINGISFTVLVIGITEFAKSIGLSGTGPIRVFAALTGLILAIGYQFGQIYPDFQVYYNVAVFGLGGAVAGMGYFDLATNRNRAEG